MCSARGFPAAPGHWTEAGTATPHDWRRARFRRTGLLKGLLSACGLTAHDDGQVPGVPPSSLAGARTVVPDPSAP